MPGLVQQSADVRFREIDLSQVIRSRSSSKAAIVLVSKKGRLGVFTTTNSKDFIGEYGIPDASVSFAHYCALDYFKEGSSLSTIRVCGAGYKYSGVLLKDSGTGVTKLQAIASGVTDPDQFDFSASITTPEIPIILFTPKSGPGSYANSLAIKIVSQNIAAPSAPVVSNSATGGSLGPGTYSYRVSAISEVGETLASTVSTIVVSALTTTGLNTLALSSVPSARGYNIFGRIGASEGLIATVGGSVTTYVDTGFITPDTSRLPIVSPALLPTPSSEFTVQVFDNDFSTVNPIEEWVCTLKDSTDGNGRQQEIVQLINGFSEYINVESNVTQLTVAVPVILATAKVSLAGGNSGAAPTNGKLIQAWEAGFEDAERIQVNILINGGYTDITLQQRLLKLAETRGDAVALLDVPSSMQKYSNSIAYRQLQLNANSSYGALYCSDVLTDDIYNGKKLYTPPSGWAAALCARTDRVAGPQFAPAGLNRGLIDILGLREEYNGQQRTDLFNAQVNYIRKFIGLGTAIFEQSTLQAKASALSWLSVRRMINVIKVSCKEFLMFSLHEPNDDFTRRQIVTSVSDYLESWKNARGLLDFSVISDDSNNPPAKYNLGILTVTIFITPVIPVHEIQVDVVITKAGVSFSEINIQNLG